MNKRIFYLDAGRPRLIIPAPSNRQRHADRLETDGEFINRIRDKDVPEGATDVLIIDVSDLPEETVTAWPIFFTAWMPVDGRIVVDMSKARDIWRDRVREARSPLLDALDIEYQLADERGDTEEKQAIGARKQALRDAPTNPRIEAALTIEALKDVWPLPVTES